MFTQRHVGVGQTRLQLPDDGPLRGRRGRRIEPDDSQVGGGDDEVRAPGQRRADAPADASAPSSG